MQVKISQATRMVLAAIKAGTVPMIHGSPGIGKSEIIHKIAADHGLYLIDLRLSQCDPTDLAGFPQIDAARQKAGYLPMDTFPLEGETPPPGYVGWFLFFDEGNSAPKAVQAAAYKIILDKKVGKFRIHKHCAMAMAGNKMTDGAIVEEMSTALQSRMAPHIELEVDAGEFGNWAEAAGVDVRITSFIKFKPSLVYTFKPDHSDFTYACPRTWVFADRLLKTTDEQDLLPVLSGTISEGVAREFLAFCKVWTKILKIEQIEASPDTVKVPDEPSILYALTGSIAQNMDDSNASRLMTFIRRLPEEFQVVCLKEALRKKPHLIKHDAFKTWRKESAASFY
jgi:hypothetical protein